LKLHLTATETTMNMRTLSPILWLVLAAFTLGLAATAQAKDDDGDYKGPRKRIAVLQFDVKAPDAKDQVGEGLTEMAITALTASGRFIVVERTELDEVIKEQNLGGSGKVREGTEAQTGQLLGAQLLLKGAVTEFQEKDSGGGLGAAIGKVAGGVGRVTAKVAVDMRLIDTTTGEIIASHRADAKTSATGVAGGMKIGGIPVAGGFFNSRAMEEAARDAIEEVVEVVVDNTKSMPWSGKVILTKDGQVYINAGSNANMAEGTVLEVSRPGEALIDPDTGLNLGTTESKIGKLRIAQVQEKFSIAEPVEGEGFDKGDIVRLAE
jgi:curli biogenesis system outer membrane secretion channel CsgG